MPFPFKSRYTHVLTHLHSRGTDAFKAVRAECDRRISDLLKRTEPLGGLEFSMLECFPEIAFVLARQLRANPRELGQIRDIPEVLYNIVIADYSAARDLEPRLLGEGQGEIIFRLLRWAQPRNIKLHFSREIYEEWLARDPFWAGHYIAAQTDSRNLGIAVECFAQKYRREDAAAAYAWMALHPEEKLADYNSVILRNPFYAYLSLTFSEKLDTLCLQRSNLTPRWAYHLAVQGSTTQQSMLEDVLMDDIGWLVEYLVDAELCFNEPKRVSYLYTTAVRRLVENQQSHVCLAALHAWVSRLTAYHKKKTNEDSERKQLAAC